MIHNNPGNYTDPMPPMGEPLPPPQVRHHPAKGEPMTIEKIMRLADAYAHEACIGNEMDNRRRTAEAREALLKALHETLKR